jgi:DNA repair exonuclease SbcCD ATPase subunit
MKLLSAKIKNYRIHTERDVTFDPRLTLIGGPNESGKSTFIEAVHRGLFLKTKGTGEVYESFQPFSGGDPEVTVRFELDGETYTVEKQFRGQSGKTRLVPANAAPLTNEAAEEELARLLGVEADRRANANSLAEKWRHLWVWQGEADNDPAGKLNDPQQSDLLARLQSAGGAVVAQSQSDSQIAEHFRNRLDTILTQTGKTKAGSELKAAEDEAEKSRQEHAEAEDRRTALDSAAQAFTDASAEIERLEKDIAENKREIEDIERKSEEAKTLQSELASRQDELAKAEEHLRALADADSQIRNLEKDRSRLGASLNPKRQRLEEAAASLDARSSEVGQTETAWDVARKHAEKARRAKSLADLIVSRLEIAERLAELERKTEAAGQHRKDIAALDEHIAECGSVAAKTLKKLKSLERDLHDARVRRDATAAEIEVIASDADVTFNGENAPAGQKHRITEPVEIRAGTTCFRVTPGSGTAIEDARAAVREHESALNKALIKAGVDSVKTAEELCEKRERLGSERRRVQDKLDGIDPDNNLSEKHDEAARELAAKDADISRRLGGTLPETVSTAEAKATAHQKTETAENAEQAEKNANTAYQTAREKRDLQEKTVHTLRTVTADDEKKLKEITTRRDILVEQHGDETTRAEKISAAEKKKTETETAENDARQKLDHLNPDRIEETRQRLQSALRRNEDGRQEQRDKKTRNETLLRADGVADPAEAVARSAARLERAEIALESARRKKDAIQRLCDLFADEQQKLSDEFSRPLAEKITGYLAYVLTDAKAEAVVKDNAFKGIRVIRKNQPVDFNALSGGAREQTAAAVRLAIAQLLAGGDTLPVVFDDSFTNSDPERVKAVQAMLYHAADQGLQIIVLSCNPSDYSGLGGTSVSFPPLTN